ncbi:helix-turn-helix domain-containing protein [bacterium SCSIO 12643]|nr:helix-turn-helix domain-containing protein [bacterium SCSIO 12643]
MESGIEIKNKIQHGINFKISPFRKNIRQTPPHKHHSYFEIVFLSSGQGTHAIDTNAFEIDTPCIFIVRQDQVHHWDIQSEPDGYVLIIKKPLVDQSHDSEFKNLFSQLSLYPYISLFDSKSIVQICQILDREHQKQNNSHLVLESLIKSLMALILQSAKNTSVTTASKKSTFQKFKDLLLTELRNSHQVAFYAQELHTTPQNLNAICKKETQKSASSVIADEILNEAKRMLLYTDLSITEIAYNLGFKDNSHFTKYFKRHTELLPSQYKNQSS